MEIHQQADTEMAQARYVRSWASWAGEKGGGGFDIQDDRIFDDDVGAKAQWNRNAFISDRQGNLSFEADAGMAQYQDHALDID